MLKKVKIRNFQKWKDLEVVFSPTVTSFVGESGKGKTAIFRAIRWVATNRPTRKKFIRHGQSLCSVTVETDRGKVTRKIKGKTNLYFVNGKRLSAVGTRVPEEVTRVLRIGPINFQNQFDGPYWLSLPPGKVAQELNKLADLSLLDRLQTAASQAARRAKTEEEVVSEQYEEAKGEAKKLSWIPECLAEYQRGEEVGNRLPLLDKKILKLDKSVRSLQDARKTSRTWDAKFREVSLILSRARTLDRMQKEVRGLEEVVKQLRSLKKRKDPSADFKVLDLARQAGDRAVEDWRQLQMYIEWHEERSERLHRKSVELEQSLALLTRTGRCPTCGSRMKPSPTSSVTPTSPSKSRSTGLTQEENTIF